MEHLFGPHTSSLPRVPYYHGIYDCKGFHGFPSRCGWKLNYDGSWVRVAATVPELACLTMEEFLQAWLFFGLLDEVIGTCGKIIRSDFQKRDYSNSTYLTTVDLDRYIRKWALFEENSPKGVEQDRRLLGAQMVLRRAHRVVSAYCSVSNAEESPVWCINDGLITSFLVLGETLSQALSNVSRKYGQIQGWEATVPLSWGTSRWVLRAMRSDRWCPRTIKHLQNLTGKSESALLYALYLSHAKALGLNHLGCTSRRCVARASRLHKYCFKTGKLCSCVVIGPSVESLVEVIKGRGYALLRYSSRTSKIEVVEPDGRESFMILSHVWDDGFGGTLDNRLPKCYFEKLTKIFERLQSMQRSLGTDKAGKQSADSMLFWMDSLAIPEDEKFSADRGLAMRTMHKVYKLANDTVVLDAGLMSQDSGSTYSEAAMRITTSFWITRLWTLQEAFLSKQLWFNFSNRLVNMDMLENAYEELPTTAIPTFSRSYYKALLGEERQKFLSRSSDLQNTDFLRSLWSAVQWRSVTSHEHETLAIATILSQDNTNLNSLVSGENSQRGNPDLQYRMRDFLTLLCQDRKHSLPSALLFCPGERLTMRGFRWAPKTWLAECEAHPHSEASRTFKGSILSEDGLLTCHPGWKLHVKRHDIDGGLDITFPTEATLSTWIRVYDVDSASKQPIVLDSKTYVIVESEAYKHGPQLGLLAMEHKSLDSIKFVHTIRHVWVQAVSGESHVEKYRAEFLNNHTSMIIGECLNADQIWCIDGADISPADESPQASPGLLERATSYMSSYSFENWTEPIFGRMKVKVLSLD